MSSGVRRGREEEHNNTATAQATNNSSNSPPDLRLQLKIDAVVAQLRKCLIDHTDKLSVVATRFIELKDLIKAAATKGNKFILLNLDCCLSELQLPPGTFNFAACSATLINDLVRAITMDTPVIDVATVLTSGEEEHNNAATAQATNNDNSSNNSPPDLRHQLKIDAVVAQLRKCLDNNTDKLFVVAKRLIELKELIKAAATKGNKFIFLILEGCLSELSLPPGTFNFAACSATVTNDLVQAITVDTPVIGSPL